VIVIEDAPEVVLKAITDNDELTKWFPDNAILEPKVGDQAKFSLYKENSERRKRDSFPEGEVVEYIPNKKIAYTWQQSDIPDFTRP
jgi:uncharacterized protein YndB with AHSA1/START domain